MQFRYWKVLPFRVSDYLVHFAGGSKGIDSELKKVTLRHGEEVEQRIYNLRCKKITVMSEPQSTHILVAVVAFM